MDSIKNLHTKRILITGKHSIVAQDLFQILTEKGYQKVTCVGREDVDLTDQRLTYDFIYRYKPEIICHIAANTAGIQDNAVKPWDILRDNLIMQINICEGAVRGKAHKIIGVSSDVALPQSCGKIVSEDDLFEGHVDRKRESYAFSKAMGIKMFEYLEKQEHIRTVSLLPCYIYGNSNKGFVFSVYKDIASAKSMGKDKVILWGKERDRIRLVHSMDVASSILYCMEHEMAADRYLVGPRDGISKRELAEVIAGIVGFHGELEFDGRETAAPPCIAASDRLKSEGWNPSVTLENGIRMLYEFARDGHVYQESQRSPLQEV